MVKANDDLRWADREREARHVDELYPEDVDAREIEEDIEHTRSAMDDTISELFDRLAPAHLLGDAIAIIRNRIRSGGKKKKRRRREHEYEYEYEDDEPGFAQKTAKAVGKQTLKIVKNYPLPSAMIVAGVTWMIVDDDRPTKKAKKQRERIIAERRAYIQPVGVGYTEGYIETDYGGETGMRGAPRGAPGYIPAEQGGGGMRERMHGAREKIGEKAGDMRERMHDARERMSEKAGDMRERMGEAAGSVREGVHHATEQAGEWVGRTRERISDTGEYISERASDLSHTVRDRASDLGRSVKHGYQQTRQTMTDNPLMAAGVAVGVGLLAGLLLPRTRTEDKYIGETADQFKERSREVGEQMAERGAEAAEHVTEAATEEVKKEVGVGEHGQSHGSSESESQRSRGGEI